MSVSNGKQIAWVGDNVIGHSIDEAGRIDATEGFGAIDSVFKTEVLGSRIIDIGGGSYDANKAYIASRYLMDCKVYDPYKRDMKHNINVIIDAMVRPVNVTLSLSILNVISNKASRLAHIRLCQALLKTGGKAIFKVWPGDGSGIGKKTNSGYQSNRDIETYIHELELVFGSNAVNYNPDEKTIRCRNVIVKHPKGSMSI